MKIETLQSLIKRNGNVIAHLENKIRYLKKQIQLENSLYLERYYINYVKLSKQKIKELAATQKELKREICNYVRYTQHGKNIPASANE